MPKAFSEKERQHIRKQLMAAGMRHFAQFGVRAARVDDICRDVGIAKGSFYSFFPCKEDLFMTIADERDIMHKTDMIAFLSGATSDATQTLVGFFDFMLERMNTDPVLNVVRDTGEISHLLRKVGPELLADNARRDRAFMLEVSELLQTRHKLPFADAGTIEGLMTLMLSLSLQAEHLVAAQAYDAAVDLMRDLFISRLLRGPFND